MSTEYETLSALISRLLDWEKRKRREAILARACCYALAGGIGAQVFVGLWRGWLWAVPLALFATLVAYFFLTWRWREQDTARALAALDHSLRLDERATTAWELLRVNDTRAVALLVLRQAGEMLKTFDPRALFPRIWSWHGYLVGPLLALWLSALWFDVGPRSNAVNTITPPALSQTLREFARKLQEKAQSEGLPRALKAGREMEKLARKGIDSKAADEQFKTELSAMAKNLAADRSATVHAPYDAAASRQQLEDLRAELEAARDLFEPATGVGEALPLGQAGQDRLAGLRQLKKQLENQNQGGQGQSRGELRNFLDKLEKQVTGELDRRTLLEAEQYLQQLAQSGRNETGETQARASKGAEQPVPGDGSREKNAGTAPGEEPGRNQEIPPSLPGFQGGARAQVKGVIGEGERSSLVFKAKPGPGKSKLSEEEVIASYRRQAEAELNTEQIPEELRDTIKNYFLALEKAP